MFHESGWVFHEFEKQINLPEKLWAFSHWDSLYLFTFRKNVPSQLERSPLKK
jgi:hypothetical protein